MAAYAIAQRARESRKGEQKGRPFIPLEVYLPSAPSETPGDLNDAQGAGVSRWLHAQTR